MGILFFIVFGFLVYTNSRLAAAAGKNPIVWGLISVAAYFVSYIFLATIYLAVVYRGAYTREALMSYLQQNPLTGLIVILLGVSGVLGVRFYLERSARRRP